MNAVSEDVKLLVEKELESANERFPQFHSEHEGWAVMQEEAEELQEECASIEMAMERSSGTVSVTVSRRRSMWLSLNSTPKRRLARQFRWRRWRESTLICWSGWTSEAVQRGDAAVSGRDAAV